jgi:hypothetical protein
MRALTLIMYGSVICAFLSGCSSQPPVEHFLTDFSGRSAVNCGRFGAFDARDADIETAMACLVAAQKEKKAFFVINDDETFDSRVASGFISKAGGNTMLFYYDSAPCGGPHCSSSFSIKECAAPRAKKERNFVKMVCE